MPSLRALQIASAPSVTSLSSLTGLASVQDSLQLSDLSILNLDGLFLTSFGGQGGAVIQLQQLPLLSSIGALANTTLSSNTSLFVLNTGVTSLIGLNATQLGAVTLQGNPSLTDVTALGAAFAIISVSIDDNDALQTLGTFTNTSSIGDLVISGNDTLTDAGSFPLLESLSGLTYLLQASLLQASSMPLVTTVNKLSIEQTGMRDLSNLNDIAVINGDLTVRSNPTLTNLSLNGQLDINGNLIVTDNPALDCQIVVTLAGRSTPLSTTSSGNQGNGTVCPNVP